MRPITPNDYPFLFTIALAPLNLTKWRFRGTTPTYDEFVSRLDEGVLAQFIIEGRHSNLPLGHVVTYAADHRNQHCYLGIVLDPEVGRPTGIEGAFLIVDYVFRTFPMRKIYAEVPGFNVSRVESMVGSLLCEEGRLVDHVYGEGRWWDAHVYAIYPGGAHEYLARLKRGSDG